MIQTVYSPCYYDGSAPTGGYATVTAGSTATVIRISRGGNNSTATSATNVAVHIRYYDNYEVYDDTWSPPKPFLGPTKWELQREASIEGARKEAPKHERIPRKALVLRASYQQMARLPGYRGKRWR